MTRDFANELDLKIKADIPVIQIISYEWRRIHGFCVKAGINNNRAIYQWTNAMGIKKWDPIDLEFKDEDDTNTPLEVLRWYQNTMPEESVLLMEDLHIYFDHTILHREIIGLIRSISRMLRNHKTLILAQPIRKLPIELEKEVFVLEIPLPDTKILRTVLKQVIDEHKLNEELSPEDDWQKISEAALGLTELEARFTFKEIIIEQAKLTSKEISYVISQKEQIIKKSGILEYFHPSESLADVGGMELLKKWLKDRKGGFDPEAKDFGMTAPKGLLLLGIPGCGKSLIAKAIASEWGLPLLKFDLGKVYGGIVGESESNIRKALDIANTIAPSILWIDEIEKGLSGVSSSDQTDAGTTARVFGTLLTWMQEKEEPVFVVATANNIAQLPPELLRKGRFDDIFFVDLPAHQSRVEIWMIHLQKRLKGRYEEGMFDLNKLSKISSGYSGSEIEETINAGLYNAYNNNREIEVKDLEGALKEIYPLSKVMGENVTKLRQWAKVRARLASGEVAETIKTEETIPKLKTEVPNPFI